MCEGGTVGSILKRGSAAGAILGGASMLAKGEPSRILAKAAKDPSVSLAPRPAAAQRSTPKKTKGRRAAAILASAQQPGQRKTLLGQ